MTIKFNLNTILLILGGLGVFAPDVASVAAWMASTHVAWLGLPVKILAFIATACAAAPLIVPKLRAFLALLGLATAPSSVTPTSTGAPAQVVPLLDGSSVVQVKPPTAGTGAQPSLVSVAVDPKQVTTTPVITQPMPPKPAA
jgi:hypothetical protein